MKTPIVDFVRAYAEKEMLRFHMPGHKGKPFLSPEPYDITEIQGADALYEASGIIRESERNAASLFGTLDTFYGTEGSSQVIRAMLYLAALYARKRKGAGRFRVLAARNVHKSFLYACAALDAEISWLPGDADASLLSIRTTKAKLLETLEKTETLPDAVFVTSPDYPGSIQDIRGFSEVLRPLHIPLLVDDAHGAYLHFLETPAHPMDLGADLCADSAHKTLPALTGCAYLHIGENAAFPEMSRFFKENAKQALAFFGSTSPSYLLLQSLDLVNAYLDGPYRDKLTAFVKEADAVKSCLKAAGFTLFGEEALKLTLLTLPYGYTGEEMAEELRACKIECEFADRECIVFMLTPENGREELYALKKALLSIRKRTALPPEKAVLPPYRPALSVREAFLLPSRRVPVEEAVGRIAGPVSVSCPPAVPVVISGEVITEAHLPLLRRYGVIALPVAETAAEEEKSSFSAD